MHLQAEGDVFKYIPVGEKSEILEHHAEPPFMGRDGKKAFSPEQHISEIRNIKSRHHADKGCFAAAGGT